MQAQNIIVIHPGSLYLRIGRASDLYPYTILHGIGRRRKKIHDKTFFHQDPLVPPLLSKNCSDKVNTEFEKQRLHVMLQCIPAYAAQQYNENSINSINSGASTPLQQISAFNKSSEPNVISNGKDDKYTVKKIIDETIFDCDIMKLDVDTAHNYNVHFPLRRGELNVHSGIGGSLSSVLTDLEDIWLYAMETNMKILRNSIPQFGAVLIISDIYNRSLLKEMIGLLLKRLRFRACFLVQDHVAATFGAGLGYACVVDIGDQKCSISCVEDGISQVDTRVRLGYGGADIAQIFFCLLQKCCFPYKDCDLINDYSDAILFKKLKERLCHLNFDKYGVQEQNFEVKKKLQCLRYTFQLGDECIIAPLAFFHTELLNICEKQRVIRVQLRSSQQPDSEDCFDAEYIRETGRVRNGRCDHLLEGSLPNTNDTVDEDLAVDTFDVDDRHSSGRHVDKEEQSYYCANNGVVVSLDLAIVRSIERCASDDMKRKMYGCILVVGGASKLNGFQRWLERRINAQLMATNNTNYRHNEANFPYEVNVCVKEMDASMIAWKGGAIMSCLESSPEVWIHSAEWEKFGLRILREKATFIW